jgi:SET domain
MDRSGNRFCHSVAFKVPILATVEKMLDARTQPRAIYMSSDFFSPWYGAMLALEGFERRSRQFASDGMDDYGGKSCPTTMLHLSVLLVVCSPLSAFSFGGGGGSSSLSSSFPEDAIALFNESDLTATSNPPYSFLLESETGNSSSTEPGGDEPSNMNLECGIWLAESTIPNAGLGMFAGRDFGEGELFQDRGDLAIPVIDLRYHQKHRGYFDFLWDEYVWNAESLFTDQDGVADMHVASVGFGAVANCHLPLVNIEEWHPSWVRSDLHRSRDPGAGAFSPYGNRSASPTRDVSAGDELFVSYGNKWFEGREYLGATIPLSRDYKRASALATAFDELERNATSRSPGACFAASQVWERFVKESAWNETSRVLAAFNHTNEEEMQQLFSQQSDLTEMRRKEARRDTSWLQKHGTCGDHIGVAPSTLRQAGQGAFARRELPQGTIVTTLPLIHIPDRTVLEMYKFKPQDALPGRVMPVPDRELGLQGYQIMLNYCMGHRSSTLLLCPYGPQASYVNHNQSRANVKLVWSDPARGNHKPSLLHMSVAALDADPSAKLSMDVVATREILKGEEIFMDYGDEWEDAWQQHVRNWKPVEDAERYVNSYALNSNTSVPLRTEFELLHDPIPNVELWCSQSYLNQTWKDFYPDNLGEFVKKVQGETFPCDILRRTANENGTYFYTAVLWSESKDSGEAEIIGKLVDVPRQAFTYYDRPYTIDLFLSNAFRHDIRIPDHMFPQAWRNLN